MERKINRTSGFRNNWFTLIYVGVLLIAGGIACTNKEALNVDSTKPTEYQREDPVPHPAIATIRENPGAYEGLILSVSGYFKGWKGKCKEPPPMTRSDWMLADDTACIYVNGPLPVGLSAMSPNDEPITINGTIKISRDGEAYIDASP